MAAGILSLGEDELLWLTVRLVEAARQVDPGLELIVGIAQPWGEYMALEDRIHSPFIFADTLIRAGLNLAAFKKSLDDHSFAAAVDSDVKLGEQVHVQGTPSMFINGTRVENPTSFDAVAQLIEAALKGPVPG